MPKGSYALDCPTESEWMVLERVCWRNGQRMDWKVKRVRGDHDEIFYDEMRTMGENWHS